MKFIKAFLIISIILSFLLLFLEGCSYQNYIPEKEHSLDQINSSKATSSYLNYPVRGYPIGMPGDGKLYWDAKENDFGNYLGTYNGLSYNGFHPGEDWNLKGGKDGSIDLDLPVYSIGKGKVEKISNLDSLGYLVVIEHSGSFNIPSNEKLYYREEKVSNIYSVYLHLKNIQVNEEDTVYENTILGYIMDPGGGPHLHFEIRKNNDNHSSDWSLIGDSKYWQKFTNGSYNGYYIDLSKMIDAGLRDPSDIIEANYKIFDFKSEVNEKESLSTETEVITEENHSEVKEEPLEVEESATVDKFVIGYPDPIGFINDFANIIDKEYEDKLITLIEDLENKTSAEIAVVTVDSLAGVTIDEYSYELFNKWGIGKKNKNNGVLLLIAVNEKSVRIEVGLGLEGIITDYIAGKILDDLVIPKFKEGNFNQGIYNCVEEIAKYIESAN
jgi:murein DD-endopeptidase MepM/ murein hydrolase activator NlpD